MLERSAVASREGVDGATLIDALGAHVRRSPEAPALFFPDGLDVRWRSWRALAAQAAAGAEALAAAGVGHGAPVAFHWRCHPDAVAADLAVQAAGGTSVAVPSLDATSPRDRAAWMLLPGEDPAALAGLPGLPVVALPAAEPPWERRAPGVHSPPAGAGGARIAGERGPGGAVPALRDVSGAEILAAARELGARIAAADPTASPRQSGRREIALAHLDPRSGGDRAFLAWALDSGSALYLEPDPRALPASAAWARPNLVACEAAPLIELARQLRRREEGRLSKLLRRGRPPHPFGRLRLLVVLGAGRLPVDDVPFWAERGVVVLRASPPSPA